MKKILILSVCIFIMFSCSNCNGVDKGIDNPPAEGFNTSSDSKAIALADSVMLAMGGRKAWDETNYIKWNFFDVRKHIWNKETGDLRIIGIQDSFDIIMNINTLEGIVNWKGINMNQPDSLAKYLQKAKEMWINDGYWLFLPFKLKDSGVTLKYMGKDKSQNGTISEAIELSFSEVGVTPNNKYIVHIDPSNYHIVQWDFYPQYEDKEPRFSTPWENYSRHGAILLSSSRGEDYTISEIAVGDSLARYLQ